jgi:hypothetical protein
MIVNRQLSSAEVLNGPRLRRFALSTPAASLLLLGAAICSQPVRGQITPMAAAAGSIDRTLSVVILPRGFFVHHMYLKAGRIAMQVRNRSMLPNLTVQLTRDGDSAPSLSSSHSPGHANNSLFFTIQPGTYNFSVAEQPQWTAQLIVVQ